MSYIFLANNRLLDVTQLALTWLGWPNGETLLWLACKFDLYQSERKSSQVNASARKACPNGVTSRPKFSTCVYLRLRLARALVLKPWRNFQISHPFVTREQFANVRNWFHCSKLVPAFQLSSRCLKMCCSLGFLLYVIHRTRKTMFGHLSKHLEEGWK